MTPVKLHRLIRDSIGHFYGEGFRQLLESGGCERLLVDLLFMRLVEEGYSVNREKSLGGRMAADLEITERKVTFVEAKQMHLKDRGRFAPQNLANDMKRHCKGECLGVMYLVDQRASSGQLHSLKFGGRNRRTTYAVDDALSKLSECFEVYPRSLTRSRIWRYEASGTVDLYAFVVRLPR